MGDKTLLIIPEPIEARDVSCYEHRHKSWLEGRVDLIFAYQASDARKILASRNVDIILMGLGLSPKDWYDEGEHVCDINTGFRVIEELRKDTRYAQTPIIIRTCFVTRGGEIDDRCKELGIEDFLIQPTLLGELYEAISKYTPQKKITTPLSLSI